MSAPPRDRFSKTRLAIHDAVHLLDRRRRDGPENRAWHHLVHDVGDGQAAIRVGDHQRAAQLESIAHVGVIDRSVEAREAQLLTKIREKGGMPLMRL